VSRRPTPERTGPGPHDTVSDRRLTPDARPAPPSYGRMIQLPTDVSRQTLALPNRATGALFSYRLTSEVRRSPCPTELQAHEEPEGLRVGHHMLMVKAGMYPARIRVGTGVGGAPSRTLAVLLVAGLTAACATGVTPTTDPSTTTSPSDSGLFPDPGARAEHVELHAVDDTRMVLAWATVGLFTVGRW